MTRLSIPTARRSVATIALVAAAALGVGAFTWFASSLFLPLAYADRPLEYVFLGARPAVSLAVTVATAIALVILHVRCVPLGTVPRWSWRSLDYLVPLALLGCAPIGAAILLAHGDVRLAPLTYVLIDLRWWWSLALVATAVVRFDRVRAGAWRKALSRAFSRWTPQVRLGVLDATLFALLFAAAIVSSPILRFSGALHGDEPKYLRLCENFYQGLGLDVAHQQSMHDLTLAYSPPLWRNATLLAQAVREDARFLLEDARTLLSHGPSYQFNRAVFVEGWFVRGRNGGFYQVHNPGLSLILFPAYFFDRHVISTDSGYQGVFPTTLPVTNLLCLVIWSLWGVVLFRFLRAALARDRLAWLLAATAMLTMPVSAFPFQIYPETSAGVIVTAACGWLLYGTPDDRRLRTAVLCGAAVGFLPWLHVRFLVTSLVLAGWGITTLRRRRLPFALAYVAMVAGICLYVYHVTGSLRPDAMYESEGSNAPWRLHDALQSLMAYPFDRIWGFLPHAPVFLFALPGWALLARADRRAAALLALLMASLVLVASGHGFTGTGATPLRFLVAVVPLAMVPLGHTLIAWGDRRWVRAAFAILLIVSLDASLSYNTYHHKEVGRMVDEAVSGWTPNLLFPWTHADPWAHWPGTFVLLLIWVLVAALLMALPLLVRRISPAVAVGRRAPDPLSLPAMALATLTFVACATAATALGGEWTRADYFVPLEAARFRTIEYGTGLDRCRACYSSFRGTIGRSNLIEDTGQTFSLRPGVDDVEVGEPSVTVVAASAKDGPDYGSLALDFGDGQTTRVGLLGRLEVPHVYASPGIHRISARFAGHGGAVQYRVLDVAVRPATIAFDEVDGLPAAVAHARVSGTIARLVYDEDRLAATLADRSSPPAVWLLAWDGQRWRACAGDRTGSLAPGWVVAVAADPAGGWRSSPVTLRWPQSRLLGGAPAVLFP